MHSTVRLSPTSVITFAIGVLAVGLLTAAAAPGGQSISATDLIPEFERTQRSADTLPPSVATAAAEASLIDSSTRLIGENGLGTFWVAEDASGNICVVSLAAGESVFSIACRPRDVFYRQGISNQFGADSVSSVEVHLIPQGVKTQPLVQLRESVEVVTGEEVRVAAAEHVSILGESRLLVLDAEASRVTGEVRLSRDDGEDLTLPDLGTGRR